MGVRKSLEDKRKANFFEWYVKMLSLRFKCLTINLVGVRKSLEDKRKANWKVSDGDE